MRVSKFMLTIAAASMATMPVVASAATANPAAKLSASNSAPASPRASAKAADQKAFGGSWLLLFLAGAAVIGGVIAGTSGKSTPSSP